MKGPAVIAALGAAQTLAWGSSYYLPAIVANSMAADLGVSQRTVEIHRAHLMEKMGASSLAQLVRMTMLADGARQTAPPPG